MSSGAAAEEKTSPLSPQQQQDGNSRSRVIYTFNKFFAEFILFLRKSDPELKKVLNANYRVFENLSSSTVHLDFFGQSVDLETIKTAEVRSEQDVDDRLLAIRPVKDVSIEDARRAGVFWSSLSYTYILSILHHIYAETRGDQDRDSDRLLEMVLKWVSKVQSGGAVSSAQPQQTTNGGEGEQEQQEKGSGEDPDSEVLDDDLLALLHKLQACEALACRARGGDQDTNGAESLLGGMGFSPETLELLQNSKIGQLAKEIGDELDPSQISPENMGNPEDMMNFSNIMDKDTLLGGIVAKMGSKVQEKLRSGELSAEEIMNEAKSLFGKLDGDKNIKNNPLLSNILQNIGGGVGAGGGRGNRPAMPDLSQMASLFNNFSGAGGAGGGGMPDISRMMASMGGLGGMGGIPGTSGGPGRGGAGGSTRERLSKKLADRKKEDNVNSLD